MSPDPESTTPGRRARQIGAVTRVLQATVAVLLVGGVLLGNLSVVVNATVALGVTFLPAVLKRDYEVVLAPSLTAWITSAVALHAVGMVWLYDTVWWWDHLTHALSASLVAAVGYTTARALDRYSDAVSFPPKFMFVYVLVFTMAFGVFWEVLEFGGRILAIRYGFEPVLKQYGIDDTMPDLLFDLVGAVLFAAFGTGRTAEVVDSVTDQLYRIDGGTEE